jgi:hypothetical protein
MGWLTDLAGICSCEPIKQRELGVVHIAIGNDGHGSQ